MDNPNLKWLVYVMENASSHHPFLDGISRWFIHVYVMENPNLKWMMTRGNEVKQSYTILQITINIHK